VSFVDRDDTLRHCASKKTNGYFVRSLLPTRDVVTGDQGTGRHVVASHPTLLGAGPRKRVIQDELNALTFDEFVGPAKRKRCLGNHLRNGILPWEAATEAAREMVEFWREGHEGDEHEIIIDIGPLEELLKGLSADRVSALEHLGEIDHAGRAKEIDLMLLETVDKRATGGPR